MLMNICAGSSTNEHVADYFVAWGGRSVMHCPTLRKCSFIKSRRLLSRLLGRNHGQTVKRKRNARTKTNPSQKCRLKSARVIAVKRPIRAWVGVAPHVIPQRLSAKLRTQAPGPRAKPLRSGRSFEAAHHPRNTCGCRFSRT